MEHGTRGATGGLSKRTPAVVFIVLLAIRAAVLAHVIGDATNHPVTDVYVLRVEQIASSSGTPYRDYPVEYMFPEAVTIQLIGGGGAQAAAIWLAVLGFGADLAAAAAVWWGWGRRPAAIYLILGTPLLLFLYQRFDLVSVALAAWGAALLARRDSVGGGIAIGSAVMLKVWPLAVAPVVLVRRRWRALTAIGAVCAVTLLVWFLVGGPSGPSQVVTFRGARGWSVESIVGDLLWLTSGRTPTLEEGALRIGAAASWAKGVLLLALLAYEVVIWRRAGRQARDTSGGVSLAAVTAVLVFSPLISEQYAAWLLPWAAVAFVGDRDERLAAVIAAAAIALTGLLSYFYQSGFGWAEIVERWTILARNAALVALLIAWYLAAPRTVPFGRDRQAAFALDPSP
jgi:Glycosyltransferase family 87